jgi:transposase
MGVTLMPLCVTYCAQVANEQSADLPVKQWTYSQFCVGYRRFAKRLKLCMRQDHRAGEKLFNDFSGPTSALMAHGQDLAKGNIFVAATGVSGYCFACAVAMQTARKRLCENQKRQSEPCHRWRNLV